MRLSERSKIWYHGSPNDSITELKASDNDENLLGTGVYFYKNKIAAMQFGDYVYKAEVPTNIRVMEKDHHLDLSLIEGILTNIGLDFYENRGNLPCGAYSPSWWFLEGKNYFDLKISRKDYLAKVQTFFRVMMNYSGIIIDYPNGGEVLFVWSKIKDIKLLDILFERIEV